MGFFHLSSIARSVAILAVLGLLGCKEVASEKGKAAPSRLVSTTKSTVTAVNPSDNEVVVSNVVRVRLLDKNGVGIPRISPSVTAITGSGSVAPGISGGGCTATDSSGYANCTLSSTIASTYTLKVLSPVVFTGGTITFTQKLYRVGFTTNPATTVTAATNFSAAATIYDRAGVAITSGTGVGSLVTLSLTTPGGATLSGGAATAAAAGTGIASFAALQVDKAGTYTLTASSGAAVTGASTSFTVGAGAASKLTFVTSPSETSANVAFSPQPIVAIADANDNPVATTTVTCLVTLTMTSPNGGSDTLVGGMVINNGSNGRADFAGQNVRVNSTIGGTGYTLTATAGGGSCPALTAATSSAFDINLSGVPHHLRLVTLPSATTPLLTPWAQQPVIEVRDIDDNPVTTDQTTSITVAKTSGAAPLAGATIIPVVNGRAAFSGLYWDSSTSGDSGTYEISFTGNNGGSLPGGAVTYTQIVNPDGLTAPFGLRYHVAPAGPVSKNQGITFEVAKVDANGHVNFTDSASNVRVQKGTGPGNITGSSVVEATLAAGIASFGNVALDTAGTYTLVAYLDDNNNNTFDGSEASVTSSPFSVTNFGAAARLEFTNTPNSPTPQSEQAEWNPAPIVNVVDAAGNLVTNATNLVTLGCYTYTGSSCTMAGTISMNAAGGIANFTGRGVRTAETGLLNLSISAASTNLITGYSSSFSGNRATPASMNYTANLVAIRNDSGIYRFSSSGSGVSPIQIEIRDSAGNRITSHGALTATAVCVGCTTFVGTGTQSFINGVATFGDLAVTATAGTPIRLDITLSSPALTASSSTVTMP